MAKNTLFCTPQYFNLQSVLQAIVRLSFFLCTVQISRKGARLPAYSVVSKNIRKDDKRMYLLKGVRLQKSASQNSLAHFFKLACQ